MLIKFFCALAAGVPVVVISGNQREVLALKWREWMTLRMLALWVGGSEKYDMKNAADQDTSMRPPPYYAIESGGFTDSSGNRLDNPDQRIAEDVRSFTQSSLYFSLTLLRSVIDLCSFSAILFSIYPLLFAVIIAYASIGTAVTVAIGKELVVLNYEVCVLQL